MKIAMMTNNYKPFIGGVPISIERLSEGLKNEGHEVIIFAPTYKAQLADDTIFRYHSFHEGLAGGVAIPNSIDPGIEKKFKEGNFDIIHVHHPFLIGNTAAYLSRKYKVPMVFTYHTRYEQYLHYAAPIRWLEEGAKQEGGFSSLQKKAVSAVKENIVPSYLKRFLNRCSHIFVPTEGMEGYLTGSCCIEEQKISVLPTGLKEDSFDDMKQEAACIRQTYHAQDCPLFISVSRLAHEKNISFLLQALAYYKMMYKKPFKMLLIGDGPGRAEYEELCKTLYLEQEIVFTGKIANQELSAYYQAADLFLFASKTETQGIVILEAMAAKTPVVAVNATGVADIVKTAVNGFCTKETTDDFTTHIHHVLENSELNRQLRKGAYHTALQYSEKEVAQKAAAVYTSIIEKQNQNFLYPLSTANVVY